MQVVIDTFRENGIVVRELRSGEPLFEVPTALFVAITFNDQHAGEKGNFSPDSSGEGAVNIYW